MAFEIDFISVPLDEASKDADAICIRWRTGDDDKPYVIGIIDGGFEAHGNAMVRHISTYYYDDMEQAPPVIDFIIITHPDLDHTVGIKTILEHFDVKRIYMNRPWLYSNELYSYVNDGRITKDSLSQRLKDKYKTIAEIERIANEYGIPIMTAFQGSVIKEKLLILSPSKEFYLNLLVESTKTPLTESTYNESMILKAARHIKQRVLSVLESWNIETIREDVETTADNETSVIIRGYIDGTGFLLTGDGGIRAITEAIEYADHRGVDLKNNIKLYQIPHHGSRHNISPSTLDGMIGLKVKYSEEKDSIAIASVAEGSDHPLKMVTNAYIRRGVKPFMTGGKTISYIDGDMPKRNMTPVPEIHFSNYVEEWDN